MKLFPYAHATHPDWKMAAALALAQLRAQMAMPHYAASPALGLLYITSHYAAVARQIVAYLTVELPGVQDWSGTVGVGIASNNVEYFDEPALALMLLDVSSEQYRVFSGVAPLPRDFYAHTALVHVDPSSPDVAELVSEMAARTTSGYLFGGLSSGPHAGLQFAYTRDVSARNADNTVLRGGLSGVAWTADVGLVSRMTQGCKTLSPARDVTDAEHNLVLSLEGVPALDVLLADLAVSLERPQEALSLVRTTLAGLVSPHDLSRQDTGMQGSSRFNADMVVRHIVGLDLARRGVAVAQPVEIGTRLSFCRRNVSAARADLVRICAEIREELEPQEISAATLHAPASANGTLAQHLAPGIAGAVYVSCAGRGGAHFGGPCAELQIVRHALGDVPLVGFFAGGEIARNHVYGYTGVLTVFTT